MGFLCISFSGSFEWFKVILYVCFFCVCVMFCFFLFVTFWPYHKEMFFCCLMINVFLLFLCPERDFDGCRNL